MLLHGVPPIIGRLVMVFDFNLDLRPIVQVAMQAIMCAQFDQDENRHIE